MGSLAGALIGCGAPKDQALDYETQIKGGKFLVVLRSSPEVVAHLRRFVSPEGADHIDVYEPPAS